jgi:YD repeat-containing protein
LTPFKTETTTYNSYDDYGNPTQITKVIADTSTTHTSVIDNVFLAVDAANWWVDKLDYSEVTSAVTYATDQGITTGTNGSKTQKRKVIWKEDNKRQLASETLTASNTAVTSVTTYNSYDSFGNSTKITASGTADATSANTNVQADSISEVSYTSSDGYFVNIEKNGLWTANAVTRSWDKRFGAVLTQTDINGLAFTNQYDAFGRKNGATSSWAPALDTIFEWCSSCATNAIYQVTSVQDGSPVVTIQLDRSNQTLQRIVSSFEVNATDKIASIETFSFDALGRLTQQTQPHFAGTTAATETYSGYDSLNRYTSKTVAASPESYSVSYNYQGIETTVTVDAGIDGSRVMKRTYNALKQLMSTTDADLELTYYHYDATGNPIVIKDVANNTITAMYDGFGNKQWFDDPNLGKWYFRHSGLSQLRWQKDAKNIESTFTFDALGRQTLRHVVGTLDSQWTYDTAKKGTLAKETRSSFVIKGVRVKLNELCCCIFSCMLITCSHPS